jgi:hypothetical protein
MSTSSTAISERVQHYILDGSAFGHRGTRP